MRLHIHLMVAATWIAQALAVSAADFSKGFEQLLSLGIPEIPAEANWVKAPRAHDPYSDYELQQLTNELTGNAWSIPGEEGKTSLLRFGEVSTTPFDPNQRSGESPGLLKTLLGGGKKKRGELPAADLKKDITRLIKTIEAVDTDSFHRPAQKPPGALLIFAAQVYQHGEKDLANQLATAIFKGNPGSTSPIDSAVSLIADATYQQAANAFFKNGDWKTYHDQCRKLIQRYPRGWISHGAVALMLPQLEKQTGGSPPIKPSLKSVKLDPDAVKAVQSFSQKPFTLPDKEFQHSPDADFPQKVIMSMQSAGLNNYNNWLLSADAALLQQTSSRTTTHPFLKITACGMEAIPVLVALTSDSALTNYPNPKAQGRYYVSSYDSASERIRTIHSSMLRPASRAELAAMLLTPIVPDPNNSGNQMDPAALGQLALMFWEQHREADKESLALVYLTEGSRNQSQLAAQTLIASTNPETRKKFEQHILNSREPLNHIQLVQSYLMKHKEGASAFLESYTKVAQTQIDSIGAEDEWRRQQAKQSERMLKNLQQLVAGKSPQEMVREIAAGKPEDTHTDIRSLLQLMQSESIDQKRNTLLLGATAATDPSIRCEFVKNLYYIGNYSYQENQTSRKLTDEEKAFWQKLVSDDRSLPEDLQDQSEENATIGSFSAGALIASIDPIAYQSLSGTAAIMQRQQSDICMEFAKAHLDGVELPELPDASKISKQRLQEIVTMAGDKKPAEIHPFLKTLTANERAAWAAWWQEPGELPLPESVRQLQSTIIERETKNMWSSHPLEKSALFPEGFEMTAESILAIIDTAAADINGHSRTIAWINQADFGPGLHAFVARVPLPEEKAEDDDSDDQSFQPAQFLQSLLYQVNFDADTTAAAQIQIYSEESNSFTWKFAEGKASLAAPSTVETFKEKFPVNSIQVSILSKADAEKLQSL